MKRYALALGLFLLPMSANACPAYLGCGCHLSELIYGTAKRSLWQAKAWLHEGSPAHQGCIGCIVVTSRGGGGHVGVARAWHGKNPVLYSWGNRRIGWHLAEYPAGRVLGLRYVGRHYTASPGPSTYQ